MPYNSDVPKIKVFFIFYDRSHSYWWWGKQKLSIYKSNSFLKIVYNNQFWSNPVSLGTCIFFSKVFIPSFSPSLGTGGNLRSMWAGRVLSWAIPGELYQNLFASALWGFLSHTILSHTVSALRKSQGPTVWPLCVIPFLSLKMSPAKEEFILLVGCLYDCFWYSLLLPWAIDLYIHEIFMEHL